MKICFIDVETTGLDPDQHEIIDLAAIVTDPETWQISQELELKVAPKHIETASDEALRINGFCADRWKDAAGLPGAMMQLFHLLDGCIPAGHNVSFDLGFLRKAWKQVGYRPTKMDYHTLDTVSLAMPLYVTGEIKSLRLAEVYRYLFGEDYPNQHTALADARASLEIAKLLIGRAKDMPWGEPNFDDKELNRSQP